MFPLPLFLICWSSLVSASEDSGKSLVRARVDGNLENASDLISCPNGIDSFLDACDNGNEEAVRLLLFGDEGTDSFSNFPYNDALNRAVVNGHSGVVSVLLKHEQVNPSADSFECFRLAFANNDTEMVKILLSHPVFDGDFIFNDLLETAVQFKADSLIDVVLRDARITSEHCMFLAVFYQRDELVRELILSQIQAGVNLESLLRDASMANDPRMVKLLLESPGAISFPWAALAVHLNDELVGVVLKSDRFDPWKNGYRLLDEIIDENALPVLSHITERLEVDLTYGNNRLFWRALNLERWDMVRHLLNNTSSVRALLILQQETGHLGSELITPSAWRKFYGNFAYFRDRPFGCVCAQQEILLRSKHKVLVQVTRLLCSLERFLAGLVYHYDIIAAHEQILFETSQAGFHDLYRRLCDLLSLYAVYPRLEVLGISDTIPILLQNLQTLL